MKDVTILIVVALAVIVTGVLYGNKMSRQDDELDKIHSAFTGINKIIKPGDRLTLGYAGVADNMAAYMHLRIRYELAPAYIAFQNYHYDTVLTMCGQGKADSFLSAIAATKRVLWQNKDDQYSYFLTTSR